MPPARHYRRSAGIARLYSASAHGHYVDWKVTSGVALCAATPILTLYHVSILTLYQWAIFPACGICVVTFSPVALAQGRGMLTGMHSLVHNIAHRLCKVCASRARSAYAGTLVTWRDAWGRVAYGPSRALGPCHLCLGTLLAAPGSARVSPCTKQPCVVTVCVCVCVCVCPTQSTADDVGALVNVGVICYLKQLLETGFFHADPHRKPTHTTPTHTHKHDTHTHRHTQAGKDACTHSPVTAQPLTHLCGFYVCVCVGGWGWVCMQLVTSSVLLTVDWLSWTSAS